MYPVTATPVPGPESWGVGLGTYVLSYYGTQPYPYNKITITLGVACTQLLLLQPLLLYYQPPRSRMHSVAATPTSLLLYIINTSGVHVPSYWHPNPTPTSIVVPFRGGEAKGE